MKNKKFVISVLPIDHDGRKMFEEFGWFNANLPSLKTVHKSKAQVFIEKRKGHGSPDDWIELLKEDHQNWRMTISYIEETNNG